MSVLNTTLGHSTFSNGSPRDLTIRADEKNPYSVTLQWQVPKFSASAISSKLLIFFTRRTRQKYFDH
jgi:hypothetical protein